MTFVFVSPPPAPPSPEARALSEKIVACVNEARENQPRLNAMDVQVAFRLAQSAFRPPFQQRIILAVLILALVEILVAGVGMSLMVGRGMPVLGFVAMVVAPAIIGIPIILMMRRPRTEEFDEFSRRDTMS